MGECDDGPDGGGAAGQSRVTDQAKAPCGSRRTTTDRPTAAGGGGAPGIEWHGPAARDTTRRSPAAPDRCRTHAFTGPRASFERGGVA